MAAISNFQSESIASTTNQFFWTDNGETNLLKRAPHGGAYATVATVTGLTTYQDTTAVAGTWYDYKINSNVSGDSNVSSVVTQVCDNVGNPATSAVVGQYANSGVVTPTDFNNLIDDLNKTLQPETNQLLPCEACVINGAVVLDCGQCSNFTVNVTSDINSVSMINCQNVGDGSITFQVPASTTKKICGFPADLGFDGSECSKNPGSLTGGSGGVGYPVKFGGRSISGAARQKVSKGKTGGTPGGVPLTLTCQTSIGGANALCSMFCTTTKAMKVVASGGTPPYTFSVTGGLGVSASGSTATLTPPTNTGSATAGTAYELRANTQTASGTDCVSQECQQDFKCDDTAVGASTGGNGCLNCNGAYPAIQNGNCTGTNRCTNCAVNICSVNQNLGAVSCVAANAPHCSADLRTGAMIAANCNPCGVSVPTKVITVKDAAGAQVSKTIQA